MRLSLPESANVTISENDFRGIRSMQPLFDNQHYLASLIQFDEADPTVLVDMHENSFDDVQVLNGQASLIYLDKA